MTTPLSQELGMNIKPEDRASGIPDHLCFRNKGYNQAVKELDQIKPDVDKLEKVIVKFSDKLWKDEHRNIHEIDHQDLSKHIIDHLSEWMK